MKIGITCYPTYGGSGAVATELGLALADRGHEVHFVSYDQPFRLGRFNERLFFHAVEMEDYPLFEHPPYALALAVSLHDVARKHDLDVVHMHYAIPHAASAYLARQMLGGERRLRIVTTLHGTDITLLGKDPAFEPVIAHAINESDAVTAVSHSLKTDTLKLFGVNREIEVIHNFICPSHFERKADEQFRRAVAPNGEPIITHISNFRPVKRVEDVVDVFAGVRAKQPAKLLLVGDGPERVRAEKRAEERGVRSDVVSIGKIKNPIEPLLVSDLFLLPSETESFGLSALEALAAGVPVIASDAGGLPEVIEHGVCGYLAPVGDVDAMARYAHAVLDERNERAAFKAAALARAQEFHVMKILPHYEAIYHRLTP